ncbi:MAG: YhbD family protein [Coriobacteriales bacterium]|jgi:DNA-binding transcriptional MerR regulator|nr:YhbD family protein [Coriobacteriales bacterium]
MSKNFEQEDSGTLADATKDASVVTILTTESQSQMALGANEPESEEQKSGGNSEITKKELLALTGISYGQLYRWKREGLIPEDWFIKRSAFTGQETFFVRERILERVAAIQAMKDVASLSEIKEALCSAPELLKTRATLLATTEMGEELLDKIINSRTPKKLSLSSLAAIVAVYEAAIEYGVNTDECVRLTSDALTTLSDYRQTPTIVAIFRATNASKLHFMISDGAQVPLCDSEIAVLSCKSIDNIAERLRLRITSCQMQEKS